MSDETIRQNVLDELEFSPAVNATKIGVAVENGIVTLTGHVVNYAEKIEAEQIAQRIKDVRGVAQEIEVRYPDSKKVHDDEIADRAAKILQWGTNVPSGKIKIEAEKGWVTLSGQTEWRFQRVAAEEAVRKLSGIMGITNLILVRPRVDSVNVKNRIEDALKRAAGLDSKAIRVVVSGGKVSLEGSVRAWFERGIAEEAAWAAPGVLNVEDHLTIR